MKPLERYQKFISSGRKPTSFFFSNTYDMKAVRAGLYRLRKDKNEMFEVKSKDCTITIFDASNPPK